MITIHAVKPGPKPKKEDHMGNM